MMTINAGIRDDIMKDALDTFGEIDELKILGYFSA